MRPGTPGFLGGRLREAREALGMSAVQLADFLEMTRGAVSAYETGASSPSPEVMQRIVARVPLPAAHYFQAIPERHAGSVFYRSMHSTTRAARVRAERRGGWLTEIVSYLRGAVTFPSPHLPVIADHCDDPMRLSNEEIESLALDLRSAWELGVGPIKNVAWLLENHGFIVSRCDLAATTLDALSWWDSVDDTPYIMLNHFKASAVRSRFDAAHELGHMVLHRQVPKGRLARSEEFRHLENQAHFFAACFLLPSSSFIDEFYSATLESLLPLKKRWGVSVKMMVHRAAELDLVADQTAKRLYVTYARRGWSRREPFDDEMPPERPMLLRRAIEMAISNGIDVRRDCQTRLGFAPRDVEELTGLPPGTLRGPSDAEIPEPAPRLKSEQRPRERSTVTSLRDRRRAREDYSDEG